MSKLIILFTLTGTFTDKLINPYQQLSQNIQVTKLYLLISTKKGIKSHQLQLPPQPRK